MTKWNLKLLYMLSLGALCLYVTTVPAGAVVSVGPQIQSALIEDVTAVDMSVTDGPSFGGLWTNEVQLSLEAQCLEADCSLDVPFWLLAANTGYLVVTLEGESTAAGASGYVLLPNTGAQHPWTLNGDNEIVMAPFTVPTSQPYDGLNGDFVISHMAADSHLEISDPLIITANTAPEPGSMALLMGGIALVEFLRRKSRA